ncbi:hypothetical protein BJV82DRAFT_625379 [Fennellomyces sp. T-0311]|nr:hypothetical protein BJV82DRAFT_625379 [Fennellomyces sp. T-0311]
MGQVGVCCLQIVILLQALLLFSCNAELSRHTPLSGHLVPRDPTTSLADPVAATTTAEESPTITPTNTHAPQPSPTHITEPSISIVLNCKEEYGTFCDKVGNATLDAITELLRVVDIDNGNITVRVNYTSFCEQKCLNDTYGWGAPGSQFAMPATDGIDQDYLYPQILAKQYRKTGNWVAQDVDIEINHDAYMNAVDYDAAELVGWNGAGVPPGGKFWFKGDSPIHDYQVDLTYIILHELLHGVGVISSWGAYFYAASSSLRTVIGDVFDEEELRLITPNPSWELLYGAGPVFITGFQRNMIFDKYLDVKFTSTNQGDLITMKDYNLQLLNFCVQDNDAFIINFVRKFLNESMSRQSAELFNTFSIANTVSFNFRLTSTNSSLFNTNTYLNQTYQRLTLLTGDSVMNSYSHPNSRNNNRPGLTISHLPDEYASTPDFIMAETFQLGVTLDQMVNTAYNDTPPITYLDTLENGTVVFRNYRSPIGPGILRMLDSMGYSTVLRRMNYTMIDTDASNQDDDGREDKTCNLKSYKGQHLSNNSAVSKLPSRNFVMLFVLLPLLLFC